MVNGFWLVVNMANLSNSTRLSLTGTGRLSKVNRRSCLTGKNRNAIQHQLPVEQRMFRIARYVQFTVHIAR